MSDNHIADEPDGACNPADICAGCRCEYSAAAPTPSDKQEVDYKRMFEDAACSLAAIDKELGIDPGEAGGAAPIIEAIRALKGDDGNCRSCVGDQCVTGPECVTLGLDAAPLAKPAEHDVPRALTDEQMTKIARKWMRDESEAAPEFYWGDLYDCIRECLTEAGAK